MKNSTNSATSKNRKYGKKKNKVGNKKIKSNDVYQIITDKIIDHLKKGVIPWRKPWRVSDVPMNLITKKPYRGMNFFLLALTPYKSNYWLTFKQAQDIGGNVKKGEKSTLIVFWKIYKKKDGSVDENGEESTENIPVLRYYNVFNADQVEGIESKIPKVEEEEKLDLDLFNDFSEAESIVENYQNKPLIKFDSNSAYYMPALDAIHMPTKETFVSVEEHYSTLFHEIIHSTGHKKRLNRLNKTAAFGNKDYSYEELVAELGSAFLCSQANISNATIENSAAYINGWLKKLRSDSKILLKAAGAAQKAADHVLSINNFPLH